VRTSTQTVTIAAPPTKVFDFVADLELLPTWAIGFAKGVRRENGSWLVRVGSGEELPIRLDVDRERGVLDFWFGPAGGEVPATTRVVANGDGAEYVFTMFQPPELPDEVFAAQVAELARELTVLKAQVESACPL
jgi:uncharacterized protein YndB with AHSA1/START domain